MATAYEAVVEKQFKKLGYSVKRLDRQKPKSRPDFLISTSSGLPKMLCEVKTVFSGGYLQRRRSSHVSMLDDELYNHGVFQNEMDLTKITGNLADAVRRARRTGSRGGKPRLAHLPHAGRFVLRLLC